MAAKDVFESFESALEHNLGTPAGRTAEDVEKEIQSAYGAVFSAIDKFGRIIKHQDNTVNYEYEFKNTSRPARSTLCVITVTRGGHPDGIPIQFDPEKITSTFRFLANCSPSGNCVWKKSETNQFIHSLGDALLSLMRS